MLVDGAGTIFDSKPGEIAKLTHKGAMNLLIDIRVYRPENIQ